MILKENLALLFMIIIPVFTLGDSNKKCYVSYVNFRKISIFGWTYIRLMDTH